MRSIELADPAPMTLQQLYRASLAVCAAALDVTDATELLDCLGLLDQISPARIPA